VSLVAKGFKQAVLTDVKVDLGTTASVRVTLAVGQASETVTIEGGGAEMVQTQSATISTTLNVNQIANLPLVSRNALNFVVFLPGVDTRASIVIRRSTACRKTRSISLSMA
jgi:hypothetical protein